MESVTKENSQGQRDGGDSGTAVQAEWLGKGSPPRQLGSEDQDEKGKKEWQVQSHEAEGHRMTVDSTLVAGLETVRSVLSLSVSKKSSQQCCGPDLFTSGWNHPYRDRTENAETETESLDLDTILR